MEAGLTKEFFVNWKLGWWKEYRNHLSEFD